MASWDEEYTTLLNLIFPTNVYPVLHDKLLRFQWKTTMHHTESFRQHCVDTARSMEEFCQEKNLLQGTWNGITYARLVGFLHDVGKPFVLKTTKKGYQLFTGHAQVGARLFYLRFQHEIPEPILLTMGIVIDSHMCCLRNDKNSAVTALRVNAVMHMYFPSLDILPILECLHRADAMSKHPSIADEQTAYLSKPPIHYRKSNKIVIFLIGPSGSGKSTLATSLQSLLSPYGSVHHLERDKILMEFALEGELYKDCYRRVYTDPNLKKEFQLRWTQVLFSAQSQILLVDTDYYQIDAKSFPHHFRIGFYCFPASLHQEKAPEIEFSPQKWLGYPTVLTEYKDAPWQLEVGTGLWQIIPTLVKRYLEQCVSLPLEKQPTIVSLWDQKYGSDAITAQYNVHGITFKKEYSFSKNDIIRVSYLNDVTYGPTRYYRGEYLLKTGEKLSMLRSGLATFSTKLDIGEPFQKIIVTPKYDGSLVNILYIPKQYPHFELLKEQFPDVYYPKYGLLFIGSKQTLIMEQSLRQRFNTATDMDFEAFIRQYAHYLKDKRMTLHFEIMVKQAQKELTVYYPENFCKFIGCTTFTDTTRQFALPTPTDLRAVQQNQFSTWVDCERYIKEQHQRLLTGDIFCEPEGFVLYVYDENGLKDIIKQKFVEYLAALNPTRYPDEYKRIWSNPLLIHRFQKCQYIKNVCWKVHPLLERLYGEFIRHWPSDRLQFILSMHRNKDKIKNWQKELTEITNELRLKPIPLEQILWENYPNVTIVINKILRPFRELTSDKLL